MNALAGERYLTVTEEVKQSLLGAEHDKLREEAGARARSHIRRGASKPSTPVFKQRCNGQWAVNHGV